MPLRTISRAGKGAGKEPEGIDRNVCPTVSFWIWGMTESGGKPRLLPRPKGMTQEEQRESRPSWIISGGRVGGVKLADGVASLGVGGGGDRTGVNDDDVGGGGGGSGSAAAVQQLALEGGTIGLRGAAAELFDEESGHVGLLH